MAEGHEPQRYTRTAVFLHWLVGLALLSQIAFGFLLDDLSPRDTPARAGIINLHKSMGVLLAVLIVLRLVWRLRHEPPAWPATMKPIEQSAARWVHRALYACMIVMPVSGFVASNFSKHGLRFFGVPLRPWGPDLPEVYALFNGLHIVTAYVFCALIAGHVLAALNHRLIQRDNVLSRMRM